MNKQQRTCIGVPAEVRDKLRIVAAMRKRSLASEVALALTDHLASFVDKHPEMATEMSLIGPSAPRARR